jgi:phenylacetate-CoA ligase
MAFLHGQLCQGMSASMIAATVDHVLSEYERHTTSPVTVKRAASMVEKLLKPDGKASVLHEIQRRRLRFAMHYVYHRSPFYCESFDQAGARPSDVCTSDDLRKLPFTTSKDILEWERFLCVSEDELAAVFTTSGMTGEPKRVYYSFRDMQALINFDALALRLVHRGRLVVLVALPMRHGLWMGSASAQRVVERAGGLPLAVGADDPRETLTWMKRFEPNLVMSSPSYMTALTSEAERSGYRQRLDAVLLGGETLSESQKVYFRDYWGAQVFNSYGSTEIGGAQTIGFPGCIACHLNDLHLVTEIIHPETGAPAQEGELVFTTLAREGMPLVRYRSGDLARWSDCPCQSSFNAVQLMGRNDDMLVARDMNLYGHILAETVAKIPGASGRVEIVLDKVALTDRLIVSVEGDDVSREALKRSLFTAYPELRTNTLNGNLILVIETGANLDRQIKALRIVDRREQQQKISLHDKTGIEAT